MLVRSIQALTRMCVPISAIALLVASGVSSCSSAPNRPKMGIACLSDADCPGGQSCNLTTGQCAPGAADAGGNDAGILPMDDAGTTPVGGDDAGIEVPPDAGSGDAGIVVTPDAGVIIHRFDAGSDSDSGTAMGSDAGADSGTVMAADGGTDAGAGMDSDAGADSGTVMAADGGADAGAGMDSDAGADSGTVMAADGGADAGTGMDSDAGAGIDAGASSLCVACTQDSDCGAAGNYCLQDNTGNYFCGTACQQTSDCPSSATCYPLTSSSSDASTGMSNCFPTNGTCGSTDAGSTDAGSTDAGSTDAGSTDAGGTDGGTSAFYCAPCQVDSDCGGGGNLCLTDSNGNSVCGTVCQQDTDCAADALCSAVSDGNGGTLGNFCTPSSGLCAAQATDGGTGSTYCLPCTLDSDCGTGNFCVGDSNGSGICGTACQTSADCSSTATCSRIGDANNNVIGNACYPTSGLCN
jgi:hypothetical protein